MPSELRGIQSRLEANSSLPAEKPNANAVQGEIASAATRQQSANLRDARKSKARIGQDSGSAAGLAPMRRLFRDSALLNVRAGRVTANEIIVLNNQGANSRRVA
jgi:hypothetical protein